MRDTMELIMKNRSRMIVGIIILLALIISLIIFYKLDTDGMNNSGIFTIKYRVYQDDWSRYSKNGMTAGDKENPIQNLDIKINEKQGLVYYNTYTNKWSEQNYKASTDNANQIFGIKINTSNVLHKKYDICYRTYNKKDKWLNWTCNGGLSGNNEEAITAIEIKMIPKGTVKFDYLKDYNKTLETNKNF